MQGTLQFDLDKKKEKEQYEAAYAAAMGTEKSARAMADLAKVRQRLDVLEADLDQEIAPQQTPVDVKKALLKVREKVQKIRAMAEE